MCINPCGHTFCKSCTDKLSNSCFICRGPVTTKIKMIIDFDDDDYNNQNTQISESNEYILTPEERLMNNGIVGFSTTGTAPTGYALY